MTEELIGLLDGLHFHTLCEQDSDALEITLDAFEAKFGAYLSRMKWVNMGGGHHITREGYDIGRLERCILRMREYGLTVYLEPGEAVALNAGYLLRTKIRTAIELLDQLYQYGEAGNIRTGTLTSESYEEDIPDISEA
jgi:carboxynorspermidine decarboxylase